MSSLPESISKLNAVAMGDKKADLLLKNCSLVSVYTGEIINKSEIAVSGDRIAYVGDDGAHTVGGKTRVVDLGGRYLAPGLADPHIHIDQFVTPSEFAKKSLLCGTTSLFSDPIDIVSVTGYSGFCEFARMTEGLPMRFFHMIPGGLPVDGKFSHGRFLSRAETRRAARLPGVPGLGEVFSWTRVTSRDPETMKILSAMLEKNRTINGHTAGMSGKKLSAYVSCGILSCHEPVDFEQVLERLRLGMWVMMREGAIRRDLGNIVPGLLAHNTGLERLMFCSDGISPDDIEKFGHIDHCIREAVRLGMGAVDAITVASRNSFEYYNMGRDLGGIAPGKLADMLVLDELESFRPRDVFVGGRQVVSNKTLTTRVRKNAAPPWMKKTVRLKKFSEGDFAVRSRASSVSANTITMLTEIITKLGSAELRTRDGNVLASAEKDVWKVAAFDRTFGTKKHAVGFLEGFGADIGAFASTWSFHENDLVVIGSNEGDMAAACNALVKSQGGMAAVRDGKVLAALPLQLGGIISTDSFEKVCSNFASVTDCIVDAGCKFKRPHLITLFLPFLALPSVRILYRGMVDVKSRSIIPVLR